MRYSDNEILSYEKIHHEQGETPLRFNTVKAVLRSYDTE